jgi:D-arabinose 1-dehydrogenase-like Zn-dependent alcohol dehydrogenase
MKAVVIREPGGPGKLRVEEVPEPTMRPNDVMIRVAACGVCFHDVVTRNGTFRRGVEMPVIPGHEISGVVERVGPQVRHLRPGDRVAALQRRHICGQCSYCRTGKEPSCAEAEFLGDAGLNGGYAELVAVEEPNLVRVPDDVSLKSAAIAACAIGTELNAIREIAAVKPGETVLVTGAGGGVGIHGVQLARLAGGYVIAVTTSKEKAKAISDAGAHSIIVVERGADFSRNVIDTTSGRGVDVVIDNVGSVSFEPTRRSLAMGGRWVLVGQLTGDFVQFNPAQFFLRDVSLLSAKSTNRKQLEDCIDLIRRGQIRPVISAEFSLEQAAAAHELVESGHSVGRVVLTPAS